MANTKPVLNIFSLGHSIMKTEWLSVLGDKYCHALPFDYRITDNIAEASVLSWDGLISLKQRSLRPEIEAHLQSGKILLIMGQSETFFHEHAMIKYFNHSDATTVHLNGWSVLPEEILDALDLCYKKIINV
jgi:hypothetical protein